MKTIDDLIKNNIEVFNSEEPFEGHFERFNKKLEKEKSRNQVRFLNSFISKAAIILLILGISSFLSYKYFFHKEPQQTPFSLSQLSPELGEMQVYYSSAINEEYRQIESIPFPDKKQKEILLHELNDMDSVYISIVNDLKVNPKDERVINALINYYRVKINVMNQILGHLKQINNKNYKGHEEKEI
jgi:hypothetical protein